MYVSKIEMTGFKSFADKIVLDLEPCITAVIGPNGCGKTNVCDAIRWVMGEDNVRLLRGTRVEDVIFAGTELRKPTGMAEVTLTLSDVQGVLPVEYDEVTVARRAFRSGESQFFINKVPCRLKDIVTLFLGTGMGRRAYSVMEREMIDWILEDTGGQRRKIIEEAAGISKYKMRRKETRNKLDLTQRDLNRVEDLISEVARRVRHLSRQAAKARRYDRLSKRIREVGVYAAAREYDGMEKKLSELKRQTVNAETEISSRAGSIDLLESEIESKRLEIIESEKEVNEVGKRVAAVNGKLQEAENEKIVIRERMRALKDKLEEIEAQKSQKRQAVESRSMELNAASEEIKAGSEAIQAKTAELSALEGEFTEAGGRLEALREKSMAFAREKLQNIQAEIDAASSLTEVRSKQAHVSELIAKLEAKESGIAGDLEALSADVASIESEASALRSECESGREEVSDIANLVTELSSRVGSIREERARLAEEAAKASSRSDLFKELVERYEGYEGGVKTLMETGKNSAAVHGVVGDLVKCRDEKYEPAVVAALSNALQYVVVEGKSHAIESVNLLKNAGRGSATMVMLDSVPGRTGRTVVESGRPGVLGRVSDYVECEEKYRSLIDYLLGNVVIVDDLDSAFSLSEGDGDGIAGFVTPEGDALFGRHIVRAGSDGHSPNVLIGRQDKVRQFSEEATSLIRLAEEQRKAFEELSASLEDLRTKQVEKQESCDRLEKALTEKEKLLGGRISELNSRRTARSEVAREINDLRETLADVEKQVAHFTGPGGQIRETQPGLFDSSAEESELSAKVTGLRANVKQTGEELHGLKSRKALLEAKVERLNLEIEALEREIEELEGAAGELVGDLEEFDRKDRVVGSRINELMTDAEGVDRERHDVVEKKRGIENEIDESRRKIKELSHEREALFEKKQAVETEANLVQVKRETLRERTLEEYDTDISTVDFAILDEIENYRQELEDLKRHIKGLGPVNLIALEEFDTEKDRLDFLESQRDDLVKARQSLDEAIIQINRKARAEFVEIFEIVRKDFRKNFQTLFEGGDADLRLADDNDPLESPVEILARPGGKKLEHISLLSGGERALTAIAFLFAVYHTRPSPFCLLDEVDAPLDDANILRFRRMLIDLSRNTQFIIVTHNKKTMEMASCLYGVTMEEPGVSKLVSVRIDREREESEEPAPVG
ncbi:MAG: chromosome segregation protein SMC [bacterium]